MMQSLLESPIYVDIGIVCVVHAEIVKATVSTLETGQGKGVVVDFKRRDSHYECITIAAVKEIIEKVRHIL